MSTNSQNVYAKCNTLADVLLALSMDSADITSTSDTEDLDSAINLSSAAFERVVELIRDGVRQ